MERKVELPIIAVKTDAGNKVKRTIITAVVERADKVETGVRAE